MKCHFGTPLLLLPGRGRFNHPFEPLHWVRSPLAQHSDVAALGLQLRRKAEIIIPADEFESPAELYQGQEFLREKDLGGNPAVDDRRRPVVIDGESQALVISLRDRIGQLGAVAGMYGHSAFAPGPASLVVVENPKPDEAVQ